MSPAFLNRFDIISLENQLKDINTAKLKKLTEALLNCEEEEEEDKNENKKDWVQSPIHFYEFKVIFKLNNNYSYYLYYLY